MRHAARAAAAVACLALCGCSAGVGPERIGFASESIAGGSTDEVDTAVVAIVGLTANATELCSGSLIAPNAVLTARHCVSDIVGGDQVDCAKATYGPLHDAAELSVTTATDVSKATFDEFAVDEIVGLPVQGDLLCGNDAALLVLAANVGSGEAKPLAPRLDGAPAAGEVYSAIGYGGTDDNGTGVGTRRRRDKLSVTCSGASCMSPEVVASEWAGDGGICRGDSGGPAVDGQGQVMGITSRGDMTCTLSIYELTGSFKTWLQDTVVYASGKGEYAPPPWTAGSKVDPRWSMPVGASCAAPSDCFSNICADGACSRPCDAQHACPAASWCQARGSLQVCVPPTPPPTKTYRSALPPPPQHGCAMAPRTADEPWAALALFAVAAIAARRRSGEDC